MAVPTAAAASSDRRVGLRAVRALRRLLETLEVIQVDDARRYGWSWQEIAVGPGEAIVAARVETTTLERSVLNALRPAA
ncbi:hypothetical protein [Micromonospora sp. Llam0]|uniref:hypothetical protein n=1 Tax=Micromonospora sp. Llam0 TaxID=2485143 RepID=UPI0018F3F2BB|nr:hypothetical protein [Micromonospora sp. Llam0]